MDRCRVDEQAVLEILVRFATTVTPELAAREVLDHLVAGLIELLPMAGVGVRLGGEDRSVMTDATDVDPVVCLGLSHEGEHVGALELYGTATLELDDAGWGHLRAIADVAASYLRLARHREDAGRRIAAWQSAALHDPLTGHAPVATVPAGTTRSLPRTRRAPYPVCEDDAPPGGVPWN